MDASLYPKLLKNAEFNYTSKLIVAHITVIKKTKSEKAKLKIKYKLFFLLSKLFIKAINNFNHLTRTVPRHKVLHTQEDIALECYINYDKCLEALKLKDVKKFYFYLNTALNRAVYRIYEQQYKCYFNLVDSSEENEHLITNAGYSQHIDFSEVDLMNLSELELDILRFKVEGGKLSVFLKEHNIPIVAYHTAFATLKEKLLQLYKEEDYFINQELAEA